MTNAARHRTPADDRFAANIKTVRGNADLSLRDVAALMTRIGHPMRFSSIRDIELCNRVVSVGEAISLCIILRTDIGTMSTEIIQSTIPAPRAPVDTATAQRNGLAPDTLRAVATQLRADARRNRSGRPDA